MRAHGASICLLDAAVGGIYLQLSRVLFCVYCAAWEYTLHATCTFTQVVFCLRIL